MFSFKYLHFVNSNRFTRNQQRILEQNKSQREDANVSKQKCYKINNWKFYKLYGKEQNLPKTSLKKEEICINDLGCFSSAEYLP